MAAANARASWRGATYDEMVAAWGQPATALNDGVSYTYTWTYAEVPHGPSSGVGIGVGMGSGRRGSGVGVGIGGSFPIGGPPPAPARCDRTVVFREGRVADESWSGPDELCAKFKKPGT